ncbi:hypothetical protein V3C99_012463 [Haemonchus contortus]|uniref:Mediator of RNA polymerase II transcription subunit 21 n=1 Tax=Haemonchus contortus TaxID=6289 RepID=A0A7I4Y4S9_HAECO
MSSAGPASVRSQKGLLTRYCNSLTHLLESFESQVGPNVSISQDPRDLEQIHAFVFQLQDTSELVSNALGSFTNTIDAMADSIDEEHEKQAMQYIDEEHEKQAMQYIDRAHGVIDRATTLAIQSN